MNAPEKPQSETAPQPTDAQPTGAKPTPADRYREQLGAPQRATGDDAEQEIWQGGYSARDMLGKWAMAGLFSIVVLGVCLAALFTVEWAFLDNYVFWLVVAGVILLVWLGFYFRLLLMQWSVHYRLTTKRFINKEGLLSRETNQMEVIRIDDVSVKQSFFQRIVNVGDITIFSSDPSDPKLTIYGIALPHEVADKVAAAMERRKREQGVRVDRI